LAVGAWKEYHGEDADLTIPQVGQGGNDGNNYYLFSATAFLEYLVRDILFAVLELCFNFQAINYEAKGNRVLLNFTMKEQKERTLYSIVNEDSNTRVRLLRLFSEGLLYAIYYSFSRYWSDVSRFWQSLRRTGVVHYTSVRLDFYCFRSGNLKK